MKKPIADLLEQRLFGRWNYREWLAAQSPRTRRLIEQFSVHERTVRQAPSKPRRGG